MQIKWEGWPRLIYEDTPRLGFPGQVFFYKDSVYWVMDEETRMWKAQTRRDHDD